MGKCQWPGRWQYKREYRKSQFSWNKSSKEECWSGNCWMYMPNITQCGREGFWRICCSFNVWFGKPLCWRFPLVWKPYKMQIYFEEILQLLGSRLSRSHYVYFQSLAMYWKTCQSRAEEVSRLAVSYFQSESERIQRFLRLHETSSDAMSELYMYFYQSVLPTFTNVNKLLQAEEPLIQSCMTRFKELWINLHQSLSNQTWYTSWNKRGCPSQNWPFYLKIKSQTQI